MGDRKQTNHDKDKQGVDPRQSSLERARLIRHDNNAGTYKQTDLEYGATDVELDCGDAPADSDAMKEYASLITAENWDALQSHIQHCRASQAEYIVHSLMSKEHRRLFFRRAKCSPWLVQYCHNVEVKETASCLGSLHLSVAKEVYRMLDLSYRLELVRNVPWESLMKVLVLLGADEWDELNLYLWYSERSVVQKMQSLCKVLVLESSDTLEKGLKQLNELSSYSETSPYAFLVDEERKYEGMILWSSMATMAVHGNVQLKSNTLGSFADKGSTLSPEITISDLKNLAWEEPTFSAIVVDPGTEIPLGFVNSTSILAILTDPEEASIVGMEGLDVSFSSSPFVLLYRKRIFWLLLLVLINVGTAYIIGSFESQLERHVVLASFIPLLTGMGGNTGSQASALIIQSLARKELFPADYLRALKKEMLVGLLLAFTLAIAGWVLGFIRGSTDVAWIVAIALACIVILSNFVGYTLPFVAKLLSVDPAAISGPMVTTLIDMIGVTIFFTTSMLFLREI